MVIVNLPQTAGELRCSTKNQTGKRERRFQRQQAAFGRSDTPPPKKEWRYVPLTVLLPEDRGFCDLPEGEDAND